MLRVPQRARFALSAVKDESLLLAPEKGARSAERPGALVGLEHEYSLSRGGEEVDFRELIDAVAVHGVQLDPGDRHAFRLRSGMAMTADGMEAEIASPPIAVRPGFEREVEAWAADGYRKLRGALDRDIDVAGYSTHISVSLPAEIVDAVALLYAETYAAALALLMEGPESLGIYVRPRPGRLELCGDYVSGPRLGAAAAFAAGTVRACAAVVTGDAPRETLPGPLAPELLLGKERFGYRLHRTAAFGFDYYAAGRAVQLPMRGGGTIGVGELLERGLWQTRAHLRGRGSGSDLEYLSAMVEGRQPLGPHRDYESANALPAPMTPPERTPFGTAMRGWTRPGFTVSAMHATWDVTVFRVAGERGAVLLAVDRPTLSRLAAQVERGALDARIRAALRSQTPFEPLEHRAQVQGARFFDTLADPGVLPPEERSPTPAVSGEATGRSGKSAAAGGASPTSGRPGKEEEPRRGKVLFLPPVPVRRPGAEPAALPSPLVPPPLVPPPRPVDTGPGPAPLQVAEKPGGIRPWTLGAAAVGALGVIGVIVAVVSQGGGDSSGGVPTATPTVAVTAAPPTAGTKDATSPAAATATRTTASASASASSTPPATPTATSTAAAATPTPDGGIPTLTPTPTQPGAVPTATPTIPGTATVRPTETQRPTNTPTLTPTPTRAVTPTPTFTPTPIIIPPPTLDPTVLPTPGCTPVPGATC